jgi:methanogenic corrinoid protein MtbC1
MTNYKPTVEHLVGLISQLRDTACIKMTKQLLEQGADPTQIMEACQRALFDIGRKYEKGEYFIAGLIMAGDIMKQVIDLVIPHIKQPIKSKGRGRVLIGTVAGDIHDLGKNMAGAMLATYGYQIKDLGVDVAPEIFLEETLRFQPHIVGLSSLLTSGQAYLQRTVQLIRQNVLPPARPVIFISGAMVIEQVRRRTGADYLVNNVAETVFLCERLMLESEAGPLKGEYGDAAEKAKKSKEPKNKLAAES